MFNQDRELALSLYKLRNRKRTSFYMSLLVPGLGQIYQGRYLTGIAFLLFFLFPFYYLYLIGDVLSYGGVSILLSQALLYLLQAYDAGRGAFRETSPCEDSCPAQVNVPSFMALCQEGKLREAYASFMARAPFPFTLGELCPAPCEKKCGVLPQRPLKIREVHREFGKEILREIDVKEREPFFGLTGKKVAVVGGGVAGLTVSYYLASCGVSVELFEKDKELGGTLRFVPQFKIDKELFKKEIAFLTSFKNLKVHLNSEVLSRPPGFDLVVVAVGALKEKKIPFSSEKVIYPLAFLREPPPLKGKRVLIIGAGDTAFDVARLTVRLGGEAKVIYRRSRENIKALKREIEPAVSEGVKVITDCSIVNLNSSLATLTCGEFNYDYLVPAVGFEVDRELIEKISGDFITGDSLTGMTTAVEAIGRARITAYEVLKELGLGKRAWFMEDFYRGKPNFKASSSSFVVSESSLCEHCGLKVKS